MTKNTDKYRVTTQADGDKSRPVQREDSRVISRDQVNKTGADAYNKTFKHSA